MVREKVLSFIALLLFFSCSKDNEGTLKEEESNGKPPVSTYDELILSREPVGYWLLDYQNKHDASKYKYDGKFLGTTSEESKLPNGESANVFNGVDSYFEIPDAPHLEIVSKGVITIEAWMRPDVENFTNVEEGKDYIHWMGKGTSGQHSWAARMYNKDSWRENRPQRISGYAFNLSGGLGAGSYFQDVIPVGTWIHYVLVINTKNTSSQYPTGYTSIYRDGKKRQQRNLIDYKIIPEDGSAPIRIATRDLGSFFKGAIGKVAIYDYELSEAQIEQHYKEMTADQ